jgi:hypothetical protein
VVKPFQRKNSMIATPTANVLITSASTIPRTGITTTR